VKRTTYLFHFTKVYDLTDFKNLQAIMKKINPKIEKSWLSLLNEEFEKPYFLEIKQFLLDEKKKGKSIYPPGGLIFNAFDKTPVDKVKVVILGQDPYHGPGQAHGLSFSVPDGVKPPPSLMNIFKEIHTSLGLPIPATGNLTSWAEQGVFLLNAVLTVEARTPTSHKKIGWGQFTDAVIQKLSDHKEGLIFMLWGNFAKGKATFIDTKKHHILSSTHPSPFSAYNGFFGNNHFKKTNELLESMGKTPINWQVTT